MEILSILTDLVGYETHNNEMAMQLHVQGILRDLGFRTELQEVLPGRPNLIAQRGQGGPLFVTHSDTFPFYDHPHPLVIKSEGDQIYGRGVLDAKGQVAALLKALSNSNGPCAVALTVDEESMGRGSEALALSADGAVVLEPTNLSVAVAEAGFVETEFDLRGEAAHSSLPEAGRNAILLALDLYEKAKALPFMQATHPLFPTPWINIGTLRGGTGPNVVAESCTIQIDLAILPGVELETAVAQIRRLSDSFEAQLRVLDLAPAFETPLTERVVGRLLGAVQSATNQPARITGMRSWTDAENLVDQGIPTIIYGAGDLAVAHSNREVVSLTDLETMARTLAAFIDSW